jgi:geranylgeranyl diphosphate synthase type I
MIAAARSASGLAILPRVTEDIATRVDAALSRFLGNCAEEVEGWSPGSVILVDEVRRLLGAGGKRIRPAFCYWGFRAAHGRDEGMGAEGIFRVAAALELLHTMALIHDDLIDGAKERRGVPTTEVWFAEHAEELGASGDPVEYGRAMAILVGDLCAVWSGELLDASLFDEAVLVPARYAFNRMRARMAVGQVLDLSAAAGDVDAARHAAALKGGEYTIEMPILIGATLADASAEEMRVLAHFGAPLGEAFQLRDDLDDGEAAPGVTPGIVDALVREAKAALDPAIIDLDAMAALMDLADRVGT